MCSISLYYIIGNPYYIHIPVSSRTQILKRGPGQIGEGAGGGGGGGGGEEVLSLEGVGGYQIAS